MSHDQSLDDAVVEPPVLYATFGARFRALVIDAAFILFVITAAMFVVASASSDFAGRVFVFTAAATLLFYDPVLVAVSGRTIGHRLANLRVRDYATNQRIGFFRAFLRSLIKTVLGVLSFFFMALTRKHQALHDVVSRSVVVIHDPRRARSFDYVLETAFEPVEPGISARRRIFVIMVYGFGWFVVMAIAPLPFVSGNCVSLNQCTSLENRIFDLAGWLIVLGLGTIAVLGWRAHLPGARH